VHVATDRLRALDTSRPPLTSNRESTTRAIIQPPTVALPMTPAGLENFSTHPPPPQLPLPSDEGVPRTDTLTPPSTRDEGVADPQPPIPKSQIDFISNDSREPSTRHEGVNGTNGHPATSCLEGVTNLKFSKQDSVDEAITRCTVVDLLSESGELAYAAKLLGPHQHPLRWDATRHCRPTIKFSKQDSVDEAITRCTVVDLLSESGELAYAAKLLGPHQHPLRWDATRHCRPTIKFSKQDSVDEAITRCTVVDLLSESGELAYAAKLLGPHQHPLRWDALSASGVGGCCAGSSRSPEATP